MVAVYIKLYQAITYQATVHCLVLYQAVSALCLVIYYLYSTDSSALTVIYICTYILCVYMCTVYRYVHHGTLLNCDEKSWDWSFNLNVKSMFHTLHAFLPQVSMANF